DLAVGMVVGRQGAIALVLRPRHHLLERLPPVHRPHSVTVSVWAPKLVQIALGQALDGFAIGGQQSVPGHGAGTGILIAESIGKTCTLGIAKSAPLLNEHCATTLSLHPTLSPGLQGRTPGVSCGSQSPLAVKKPAPQVPQATIFQPAERNPVQSP